MKRSALATLSAVVLLGACAAPLAADAQSYNGYGYGYAYERPHGPPPWVQERWARREARQQYWAQQREVEQRRAYEAGRRSAYRGQDWGYRGG